MMDSACWYTLWVKPHKERLVAQSLTSQNIDHFLPLVKVNPKNPRAAKYRPYFPGYLFVHADLDQLGANRFNWFPGTRGLVGFDNTPTVVPNYLIRQLEDQLFHLEQAGGLHAKQFQPGDRIRITRGPLAGYEGMFDMHVSGKERVQILLAFLSNHPHPLQIDAADIEKL